MHAVKRFAKWGGIVHVRVERIPVSEAVIKLPYASAIEIIENKSELSALPLMQSLCFVVTMKEKPEMVRSHAHFRCFCYKIK